MKSNTRFCAALCASIALGASWVPSANAQETNSCSLLRWTTLGTAGGPVPTAQRGEPANLLEAGDMVILVDAGDGAANALGKAGLLVGKVRTIFLSHLHWDHVGGLAAVVGLRWMNEYPDLLTIYGPPGTQEVVDGIIASLGPPSRVGFGLGEAPRQPAAGVKVVELRGGDTADVGEVVARSVENSHYDTAAAGESDTLSLSYHFEFAGRSITYTGDTGPSTAVTQIARGSDLLVSEVISLEPLIASLRQTRPDMPDSVATDMQRHLAAHHLQPEAVGRMANDAQAGHVVLTHYAMPGSLEQNASPLLAGVRQAYAGPVDLAEDMQSFDVGCQRSKETFQ